MLKSIGQVSLALSLLFVSTYGWAQASDAVQSPVIKSGDKWLFNDVIKKGATGYIEQRTEIVVERVDDTTMTIGLKHDGAPTGSEDHIVGIDWGQRRFLDGHETETSKPFQFPMGVGHKWTIDITDPTHRGNQLSAHVHTNYTVVGWEDVTVPAGHFHALRITSNGVDEVMMEIPASAGGSVVASGGGTASASHAERGGIGKLIRVTHCDLYYVPSVKNYVRSVEEQYNTDNILTYRQTRTLISFTPSV